MAGKLRHIAISVPDPWAVAPFYQQAFGMEKIGETDSSLARGVYLSDGVICLALLSFKDDKHAGPLGREHVGLHHIGFWVDDLAESRAACEAAGGAISWARCRSRAIASTRSSTSTPMA